MAKPNFKNSSVFTENLVAIQMRKLCVEYNKPVYVGFTVLELSKTILYEFYYNYIKRKYGERATLLYTDTDSLILEVKTENFYEDMKTDLDKYDTSKFKSHNKHGMPINESVLGRMKDEYSGQVLRLFLGTGAKAYYVQSEDKMDFFEKYIKSKYGNNSTVLSLGGDYMHIEITTEYDNNDFDAYLEHIKSAYKGDSDIDVCKTNNNNNTILLRIGNGFMKKAKGVRDYVSISQVDYENVVENEGAVIHKTMSVFRSNMHDVYTDLKNKIALSHRDDKRFVIPSSVRTLAWGHKDIEKYTQK